MIFRKGSAHSNHGTDYIDRVRAGVKLIRNRYSENIPIILCAESGFADQKAYKVFEKDLEIHYITTGKFYGDTKDFIKELPTNTFGQISKNKAIWRFFEVELTVRAN